MIPLSEPNLRGNEWKYVKDCLDTNFVSTAGPYVNKFEELFSAFLGVPKSTAVMNGTAAIHTALILSNVQAQDEVLVPNLTFVAPINAVRYVGASPIFIDSQWDNLGLDVLKLESFLKSHCEYNGESCINKSTGKTVKAIIPVHIFGHALDMPRIVDLCKKYNIKVIEDASESLGAKWENQMTGTFGDFGCFSFNGNKIITTGGGGILVCKDPKNSAKAKHITTTAKINNLEFFHDEVGYNYRMVNVLAALGVAQIEKIEEFIKIKTENALKYHAEISKIKGLQFYLPQHTNFSNHWFYSIIVDSHFPMTKDQLINYLMENKVDVRPVWTLMKDLPMFESFQSTELTTSKEIRSKLINIPCSTSISQEQINTVCNILQKAREK